MVTEDQLDNLVYEIRDLIKILNATTGTRGTLANPGLDRNTASLDKSTQGTSRLILGLAKLAASLDGTKRTRAEEQKSMKRFAADVDRASKAQEKQQAQIEKTLVAQTKAKVTAEELAEAEKKAKLEVAAKTDQDRKDRLSSQQSRIRESAQAKSSSQQLYSTYTNLGSGTDLLKTRFFDLAGDSMKGQVALQVFSAGIEGAAKAIGTYSTALYKGERGAMVSAKALTDLVSPVLKVIDTLGIIVQIGSFFVPGGLLIKGVVAAGGALLSLGAKAGEVALKFNELAAEQADKLFKSFQLLSRSGAAGARGMDDVFDNMQAMGMTVAELDEFNELLSKNSQKLSLMGTTAAQGARAFADVAGGLYKSKLGEQLEMLGMNAGEQRDAALAYMDIQARTGRLELRNTDLLIKKSSDFARELDLAATLTGQTRKEQAAAREAALAETRFRAAMVAAQQSGDTERMARLDAAQQAAALAKAMGDERGFKGILQYAAGGMTTPEAVAAEQTYRISEILARPSQSQLEMAQHMGASVKLQQEALANSTALVGNIDALQTDFVKTADFQQRIANLMEEANKQGFTGSDALQKVLETEQGKRIAAGGDTKLMVEAGRAQQSAAMTMDSVVSTFNGAAKIHDIAAKTFDGAVKLFATTVGAKAVVGGTPTTGETGTAVPGLPKVEVAESAAKVAKATADIALEQAAVANDQLKEAEIELARMKTARASKEEQQKAQDKITQALKEKEKLEQEEINAAYEARQKHLEAKNARQRARRGEAPTTGNVPPATATPGAPALPSAPVPAPVPITAKEASEARKTTQTKLETSTATREKAEKTSGRDSQEAKDARIAEDKARVEAEKARRLEETATRNAAKGLPTFKESTAVPTTSAPTPPLKNGREETPEGIIEAMKAGALTMGNVPPGTAPPAPPGAPTTGKVPPVTAPLAGTSRMQESPRPADPAMVAQQRAGAPTTGKVPPVTAPLAGTSRMQEPSRPADPAMVAQQRAGAPTTGKVPPVTASPAPPAGTSRMQESPRPADPAMVAQQRAGAPITGNVPPVTASPAPLSIGGSSTAPTVAGANAELTKYAKISGANNKSLGFSALAENITKFESGQQGYAGTGYNAYNRGTVGNKMIGADKPIDFSKMTVAEYLQHGKLTHPKGPDGKQIVNPDKIFAVGKYQIIPATMEGLVKKLGLDPGKTILDKDTQDLLFNEGLIKQARPNVASYLEGKSNNRDLAILDLAKEFASVGVPYPAGKATARGESYYAGIGGNKAHNPPEAVGAALDADRKTKISAAEGGILSGPTSGYRAILHGSEAVVPLPDGKNIPVNLGSGGGGGGMDNLGTAIENLRTDLREFVSMQRGQTSGEMSRLLSDLVDLQRRNNSTLGSLLQVSAN